MVLFKLLLKGLLAGTIVGFVTSSIKHWVDRIFLVIFLVSIVNLPIKDTIVMNLIVLGMAALMLALHQCPALTSWKWIGLLCFLPAFLKEFWEASIIAGQRSMLLIVLGIYAILVGL